MENQKSDVMENKNKVWLKRLGIGGFLFFLAKGLVWLAVIFGVGKCFA